MGHSRVIRTGAIHTVLVILAVLNSSVEGNTQSDALVQKGFSALRAARNELALESFVAAENSDPHDAQAALFTGLALNRLGRNDEALTHLEKAQSLGLASPDILFERGWALTGLGKWHDAIDTLTEYERVRPGRGQTSEFLGRAYMNSGDNEKARIYFDEAIKRDPALAPTVRIYTALLDQRQNQDVQASAQINALLAENPDSLTSRVIRDRLGQLGAPEPTARFWTFEVSAAAGYNTNARGLFDTGNLSHVPSAGSFFSRQSVNGAISLQPTTSDRISMSYTLVSDLYTRSSDADSIDQYATVGWEHLWSKHISTSVQGMDDYQLIGGDQYRQQPGGRGSIDLGATSWLTIEASYSYQGNRFFFDPVDNFMNRNGDTNTFSLSGIADFPNRGLQFRGGYFYSCTHALGNDFDSRGSGLFMAASQQLPWQMTATFLISYETDKYDNLNSITETVNVQPFKRADDLMGVSVSISKAFFPHLVGFVTYDYNRNRSNVSFYRDEQHIVTSGLTWRF